MATSTSGIRTYPCAPTAHFAFLRVKARLFRSGPTPDTNMDQHTPTVDDNLGPHALGICTPILVIALLLYLVRIISRTTPKFRLDYVDYIVSLAVVCIPSYSLSVKGNLRPCAAMRNRYLLLFYYYNGLWFWTPHLLLIG